MSDGFWVFVSASIMRMRALVGIRCLTAISGGSAESELLGELPTCSPDGNVVATMTPFFRSAWYTRLLRRKTCRRYNHGLRIGIGLALAPAYEELMPTRGSVCTFEISKSDVKVCLLTGW